MIVMNQPTKTAFTAKRCGIVDNFRALIGFFGRNTGISLDY